MVKILLSIKLLAWLFIMLSSFYLLFNSNVFKNEPITNNNVKINNTLLINKLNKIHYISYKNSEERNIWADDLIDSLKLYDDSEKVKLLIDSIENFKNNQSSNRIDIMLSVINVTTNSNFLYSKGEIK
jgi:hypothetical protein